VVRVTRHGGSWQLRPIDAGLATFARYEMRIDLAGLVPVWLARRSEGKEVALVVEEFSRMMDAERERRPSSLSGRPELSTPPAGADRSRSGNR
jgi:hypothetical protein